MNHQSEEMSGLGGLIELLAQHVKLGGCKFHYKREYVDDFGELIKIHMLLSVGVTCG